MGGSKTAFTRRKAVLGAGLGLSAFAAAASARQSQAEQPIAVGSLEYWVQKDAVKLYVYRKFTGAPQTNADKPVLFFVHGSSGSGRSAYDLKVPGRGEYSMMDVFARLGFDCWTMDHENHGRSSRTTSNSDIASGAADIAAAADVVTRETAQRRLNFFGISAGALRVGVYAMARPDRVDRLALASFTYTGRGSPTLQERAKQVDVYRASNRRKRGREAIMSILSHDMPGTMDLAVGEALADAELQFGDEVPTGTYLDMSVNLPLVHPEKILAPVLLIRGEHDGNATMEDLTAFFQRLPNANRQFVVLAGAAHAVILGPNRAQVWHAFNAFLTLPSPEKS
ncbi:MAG: alpha/beta fold hydrolase [Rhodospirillaceae bacterium]|nr:alpha/beta fold hydrolase [Rhodospirillaceae bacterium]